MCAYPGGPVSAGCGAVADYILDMNLRILSDDVLAIRLVPVGNFRNRYYALFIGGQYVQSFFVGFDDQDVLVPLLPGTTFGSAYIEDAGRWPTFDPDVYVPSQRAVDWEALTANNMLFAWDSTYYVTAVEGDAQLSSIVVVGAVRGQNVAPVPGMNTRGRLNYSITTTGTTHIVRFWDDGTLVAEGSRVGNGAVMCAAMNSLGLSATATLTYTADLAQGVAIVDLRWPKAYQVHYSTSSLSFPRTPEHTENDHGDHYNWLSPPLANGTYNWSVLEIDDEGVVQTTSIPAPTALVVANAPSSPTITSVTGTAAALTAHWSGGTAGSTYTVYYSDVNLPVNFGRFATPAPIVTGVDATSQVLAAITGYAAVSVQSDINALEAAFDAQVALFNAAFAAGESGFVAVITTGLAALQAAIDAYATAIGASLSGQKDALVVTTNNLLFAENSLSDLGLATTDWKNNIGQQYAPFISFLGELLKHQPGRYTLPNGAIGGGATGSSTVGTGTGLDGTSGFTVAGIGNSLEDAASPITRTGHVRIVVRATKGGVQEQGDNQYTVELADDGSIVDPRPPTPGITGATATTSTITATVQVLSDNVATAATSLDFYAVATGSPMDPTTPSSTVSLAAPVGGLQQASVTATGLASGWYDIAAASRTGSTRSSLSGLSHVFIGVDGTQAVSNLRASVARGRGNQNG